MIDRRAVLRLLASLSCAPAIAQARGRRQPVALLLPLTGPSAAVGILLQRAASLVQTGPADALLALDTGDTPESAAAAARLALRQGAKLLIGPLHSAQVRPVLAVAGRVPVVSFSNDEELLDSGAFLLGLTASQLAAALLPYSRTRGVRTVAAMVGSDPWSRQLAAAAARIGADAGLAVTSLAAAPEAIGSAAALQAAHGGTLPDALLVPGGGEAVQALGRGLRGSGVQLLLSVDAIAGGAQALADLDGAWIAAPDPRAYDAFLRAFQDRHGGAPGLIAALGYDAAVAARDLRVAGTIDRASVLAAGPFEGATGRLRFRSDGSCARALAVLVAADGSYAVAKPADAA